jgi:hypothetical protein
MKSLKAFAQELVLVLLVVVSVKGTGAGDQSPEQDFKSVDLKKSRLEQLAAARPQVQTDLSLSFAYPVPFMPSVGDKRIVFTNLTPEAFIEVRTLHGVLVKEMYERDGDGELAWDVKNHRGETLASDVYLYTIRSADDAKTGKLVILQ